MEPTKQQPCESVADRQQRRISRIKKPSSCVAQHLPPKQKPQNTAKLSPILLPRTLSFASNTNAAPPRRSSVDRKMGDGKQGRRRRSSSLMIYKEPLESPERLSDQSALPNLNADWVHAKGAYGFCSSSVQRQHELCNGPGRKADRSQEHG